MGAVANGTWWSEWTALKPEIERMDREQAMIGTGDCQRCNALATEINELRMQAEIDHACYRQRESDLQEQIDALVAEKKNGLCRCDGFNTRNVGD